MRNPGEMGRAFSGRLRCGVVAFSAAVRKRGRMAGNGGQMAVQEQKLRRTKKQSIETGGARLSQTSGEGKPAVASEQDELLQLGIEREIQEDLGRLSRALAAGARQGRPMESKLVLEMAKKKPRKAPEKKPWSMAKAWARERQWQGPQSEEGAEVDFGGLEPE